MINKINPLFYRFLGCFIKKVTEIVVIFENGKADPIFYGIGLFLCNVSPNKSMWLFCRSLETNLCLMLSFCRGNEKNHPSHRVISAKGGFFSNYAPKKAIFFRDKREFRRDRCGGTCRRAELQLRRSFAKVFSSPLRGWRGYRKRTPRRKKEF